MAHLIETIYDTSIPNAVSLLEKTHELIVNCAHTTQSTSISDSSAWGEQLKRLEVSLPCGEALIGKPKEKFVEIINVLATVERTISALKWLLEAYPMSLLRECHPSTSDNAEGSDIVLTDRNNNIIVRCEVTDVVSSTAASNGKEKKDLRNLKCSERVPDDGVIRYIATSTEFANALSSPSRKWHNMHYHYIRHETNQKNRTVLLEIKSR